MQIANVILFIYTRAVWNVRGLALLVRVET
jgi:hypothetical protein